MGKNLSKYMAEDSVALEAAPVVTTEEHSLFIKDKPEGGKLYKLYLEDFMEAGTQVHELIDTLSEAEPENGDELQIHINSNGGSISDGLRIIGNVKEFFGSSITVYLDRTGKSMGALMFISFDKRVARIDGELMFHTYSNFLFGKGTEIDSQSEHMKELFTELMDTYLIKPKFFTKQEVERMIDGKDYWFRIEELCKRNLVTHVLSDGVEIPSPMYLDYKKLDDPKETLKEYFLRVSK